MNKIFFYLERKVFVIALVTSCLIHILAMVCLLFAKFYQHKPEEVKKLEVVYQSKVSEPQEPEAKRDDGDQIKERPLLAQPQMLTKKAKADRSLFQEPQKEPMKWEPQKQALTESPKPAVPSGKRQITVPMLASVKGEHVQGLDAYENRIRNKIKNRAYFFVDDPALKNGQVYLTFVLDAQGRLKQVKIVDEKTQANNYLRQIGLRSVQESQPFPPFPANLSFPELTFNVLISFEVEE